AAVLVDEVDSAAVRQLHHAGDDVLRAVVDPLVHAEVPGAVELLLAGRVPDHVGASDARELNRRGPDAAADRVHHHGLAGAEVAAREQHVPRGREGDLERRGILVRDLVGDPDQVLGLDDDALGVAAAGREADEAGRQAQVLAAAAAVPAVAAGVHDVRVDAVADRPALDAFPELCNVAGDLDAER